MGIPAWAGDQLSQDRPRLRARGEGQEIEFKQQFPDQVSDLAKEIAAFATSNSGTVLIGVRDNGDLVGLEGCKEAEARDGFLRRAQSCADPNASPPKGRRGQELQISLRGVAAVVRGCMLTPI